MFFGMISKKQESAVFLRRHNGDCRYYVAVENCIIRFKVWSKVSETKENN